MLYLCMQLLRLATHARRKCRWVNLEVLEVLRPRIGECGTWICNGLVGREMPHNSLSNSDTAYRFQRLRQSSLFQCLCELK